MLDLNTAKPLIRYDIEAVSAGLAACAPDWIPRYFPQARRINGELRLADITGRAPRKQGSCVITLIGHDAGCWYDHAEAIGGGPLDILARVTGLSGYELYAFGAEIARVSPQAVNGRQRHGMPPLPTWPGTAKPPGGVPAASVYTSNTPASHSHTENTPAEPAPATAQARYSRRDYTNEIAHIRRHCVPLAGTLGDTYLQARLLDDPASPDLLFHPNLTDWHDSRGRPAIVAVVRDPVTGAETGGIHRTYLRDDGSGKADLETVAPAAKSKMMLGPHGNGVVRLYPVGGSAGDTLGVGEGIETAVAAHALFHVPVWACLSAGALAAFQWPPGLSGLRIYADSGNAGQVAAQTLLARATAAGLPTEIVSPLHGDDFADDIAHGRQPEPIAAQSVASAPVIHTLDSILCAAALLSRDSDPREISAVVQSIAGLRLDAIHERRALDIVRAKTGIAVRNLEKAVKDIRKISGPGRGSSSNWLSQVSTYESGEPKPSMSNVLIYLRSVGDLGKIVAWNEFTLRVDLLAEPPWSATPNTPCNRPWNDLDDLYLTEQIQVAGLDVNKLIVRDAIRVIANANKYHPVRDYLNALAWDGIERIDTWLADFAGASGERPDLILGAKWLTGAVRRVFEPGCKFDFMLVLIGPGDIGKSSVFRALATSAWFTDDLGDVQHKDSPAKLAGKLIIELAELASLRGRIESNAVHAFVSRQTDNYRTPYGFRPEDHDRQCVFAGTANDTDWLQGHAAERRYWLFDTESIDLEGLAAARDQLWAEAVHRYRTGDQTWITDDAVKGYAERERDLATSPTDVWRDAIEAKLAEWVITHRLDENFGKLTIGRVLTDFLSLDIRECGKSEEVRAGKILRSLGWHPAEDRTSIPRRWYIPIKPETISANLSY